MNLLALAYSILGQTVKVSFSLKESRPWKSVSFTSCHVSQS